MGQTETTETLKLRFLIQEKAQHLADNDYYKVFNIPQNSSADEVRNAYFALAKKLHPDSLVKVGIENERQKSIDVFKGIANAYRILTDPRKKAEYDAIWAKATGVNLTPTQAKTKKDLEAEAKMYFHKATLVTRRRQWDEAAMLLRKAVERDQRNPEYLVALGWAVMQSERVRPTRRLEEARGWFERAINTEKPTASAHYHMALYYKALGDGKKQRVELQDALNIDPGHVGAQRERRLLNMRARNSGKPDIFAAIKKWFKKQTKGGKK